MTLPALEQDPPPLVLDVPAIGDAAVRIATRNDGMRAYIAAILAVPIGPQPVIVGGKKAADYDPLAKQAPFKAALMRAQASAGAIRGNLDTLHLLAAGGAREQADSIIAPLQQVVDLVQGESVTPEQQGRIVIGMGTAWAHTMILAMTLEQVSRGVTDFLGRLVEDHETLSRGPLALRPVVDEVRRGIAADAQPYLLNPMTAGIGKTFLDIGNAVLVTVDRLDAAIGRALEGHEAMQAGASALGVAMGSVRVKYEAAYAAAGRASRADLPDAMRRYRLNTAIASWNQFADFFTRSGF